MKTHRFDITSFVFGVIFLVFTISAVWNVNLNFSLSVWVLPGAALVLGFGLLASTLRTDGQARESSELPETPDRDS